MSDSADDEYDDEEDANDDDDEFPEPVEDPRASEEFKEQMLRIQGEVEKEDAAIREAEEQALAKQTSALARQQAHRVRQLASSRAH